MQPYQFYVIYLITVSFITFIFYFVDKLKAIANAWRIPEKVLVILSIIGGAFGGLLATYTLRHKTKHWYFVYGMPMILILQIIAIIGLLIAPIEIRLL